MILKSWSALFLFALIGSLALASCNRPVTWNEKSDLPSDHVVSLDGVSHKRGYDDPYETGNWCADARCHHANLRGGFALAEIDDVDGLEPAATPSCYQCHGKIWRDRWPEFVEVLQPSASVVWPTGASRLIEWWGPPAESYSVGLFKGEEEVAVLAAMEPRDGVFRVDAVETGWGSGNNFRIQVEDNEGNVGLSPPFSICSPDKIQNVYSPDRDTVVSQSGELFVFWECAAGVVVDIFLHRNGEFVDWVRRGTGNTGAMGRVVSSTWGTGTGFRILLVDEDGNRGFSQEFEIVESG